MAFQTALPARAGTLCVRKTCLEIYCQANGQSKPDTLRSLLRVEKEPPSQARVELNRLVEEISARPAAQAAVALKELHAFKTEMDEEARRHMFRHLATQAS